VTVIYKWSMGKEVKHLTFHFCSRRECMSNPHGGWWSIGKGLEHWRDGIKLIEEGISIGRSR